MASTSADGNIWTISGAKAATDPTPAKLTAATLRKSRRRTPSSDDVPEVLAGAVDALVAILSLFDAFQMPGRHLHDAAPAVHDQCDWRV
jgi:hypothetical protein